MSDEKTPAADAVSPDAEVRWRAAASLADVPGSASETQLVDLLSDSDYRVRERAVAALSRRFTPRVAAACATALADEENAGRRGSALALLSRAGENGRVVLLTALEHPGVDVRLAAATALPGARADAKTVSALEAAFRRESDPNARGELLRAMGRTGRRDAVRTLLAVLDEGTLWLRVHALEGLGEIGDPEVAARLLPLLEQAPLRRAVLRTLARLESGAPAEELARHAARGETDGPLLAALRRAVDASPEETVARVRQIWPQAAEVLKGILSDFETPLDERTDAAHLAARLDLPGASGLLVTAGPFEDGFDALTRLPDARFTESLHAVLQAEDPEPALALVVRARSRGETKGLLPLLVHPSPVVRAAVLGSLPAGAVPLEDLLLALAEEDPETALPAAFALAAESPDDSPGGRKRKIGALLDRARSGDGPGRGAAILALADVPGSEVDGVLRKALISKDPEVRRAAASAAAVRDGISEEDLSPSLEDEDHTVRAAALRSLARWVSRRGRSGLLGWRDLLPHLADEPVAAAAAGAAIIALAGPDRPRLAEEMLAQDGTIRLAALEEIPQTGDAAAAEAVAFAVGHEDPETVRAVIEAVQVAPDAVAEETFIRALSDVRAEVRQAAAEAVADRKRAAAGSRLPGAVAAALAEERSARVLRPLLRAVAAVGDASAIDPLTGVLARERAEKGAEEAALALAARHPEEVRAAWAVAPARAERRWAQAITAVTRGRRETAKA